MKGLYKSDELEAAFIKESKENKLLFLNKVIVVVGKRIFGSFWIIFVFNIIIKSKGVVIGQQLSVKANKIAAGAEAEKTNDLLQNLAKSVNMKVG